MTADAAGAKHAARLEGRAARRSVPSSERPLQAAAAAGQLLALPEVADARTVLAYVATPEEIDPAPVGAHTGNVVYVDDRSDKGDLWVREGRTGISRPLCAEPGTQTTPSFAAEHAVWADARDGQPDVYAADLHFPTVTVPSALTCDYAGTVKLTGKLYTEGVNGQRIHVTGYGAERTVSARRTGVGVGTYTLPMYKVRRKLTLRVWYPGNGSHLPAWGGTVRVTPRAVLSRPDLKRTPARREGAYGVILDRDRCTISGTIRPRHAAGSHPVTLNIYRINKYMIGDWKLYKTLRPAVKNAGAVSSYRVRLDLSAWWTWKVQVVHQDAGHARTISAFSRTVPATI